MKSIKQIMTKSENCRPEKYRFNADDIEVGFGNKIPLWLFGFLY